MISFFIGFIHGREVVSEVKQREDEVKEVRQLKVIMMIMRTRALYNRLKKEQKKPNSTPMFSHHLSICNIILVLLSYGYVLH